MSWRLARSLETLRDEVQQRWPDTTVWTVGDADHRDRPSDHNPSDHDDDATTPGVVSAIDIVGHAQSDAVWSHLRDTGDVRVEYMIHDGKVTGADHGWQIRNYTGSNAHTNHLHVSVGRGTDSDLTRPDLFDDPAPWGLLEDDMALTEAEQETVRQIHKALNDVSPASDGWFAKFAVQHLRNHPSTSGLSEADVRRIATEVVRQIKLP